MSGLKPFHNKCRAYGKLIEENLNGEVDIRFHGYMLLLSEQEHGLDHQFETNSWHRPVEEYDKPIREVTVEAIVNDLVLKDTEWKPRVANKMLRDLKKCASTTST